MAGTTDTIPAKLTPGEFVIKREAVDMIGVPFLNKLNNVPDEGGGHKAIDELIALASMEDMKKMYGGGMVEMMGGGMVKNKMMGYGHGGMVKSPIMGMQKGGMAKEKKGYGYQEGGLAKYGKAIGKMALGALFPGSFLPGHQKGLDLAWDKISDALSSKEVLKKGLPEINMDQVALMSRARNALSPEDREMVDSGAASIPIPQPRSYVDRVMERNKNLTSEYGDDVFKRGIFSSRELIDMIPSYQEGGEVSVYENIVNPDGSISSLIEKITDDGPRYYLGQALRPQPHLSKKMAYKRAQDKMINTPQDSISFDMVQQMLTPEPE